MENLEINNLFGGIYKGRKVLVTGHTGFKGSWLIYWLHKLSAELFGLSLDSPTSPNHISLLNFPHVSYIQDINDKEKVFEILQKVNPDIIFHLAAQPLVRFSYEEPVITYLTNIMGTVNVLEAARSLSNLKAIIVITSDKCYENKEWIWGYRENDVLGGKDPYSASKACVELIVSSYRFSFFNAESYNNKHHVLLASVRAGNVIGGGDWAADRIIPDIIRSTVENKYTILRNPMATRPWQHVLEPLSGYLTLGWKLLEGKKEFANSWNFGPNYCNNVTVLNLVLESQKHWNKIKYRMDKNKQPHEAEFLMLDSSKAIKLLNWEPIWDFGMTVKYTIDWYKEYYENGHLITDDTINNYIKDSKSKHVAWNH